MVRGLLLVLLFFTPCILSAQTKTFSYHRNGKDITMTDGKATYRFGRYINKTNTVKEKRVEVKEGEYRIVINVNPTGAELKTLVNSKDSVLGTSYLSGKNKNAIHLPDGRMLQREKSPSGNWIYKEEGKTVLTYRAQKNADKSKNIIVEYQDRTLPSDTMEIICLEHGAGLLHENRNLLVVGVAVGLALMRVALAAGG